MIKILQTIFLILFIAFCCEASSQKGKEFLYIDKIALQIPDSLSFSSQEIADYINSNLSTQIEKARAIFSWISENIQYDTDNIYSLRLERNSNILVNQILKTRKGICHDYAILYKDIANKVGIKTYIISGYTKQKRHISFNPHAWCASFIDSNWYFIDPTWGAGYMQDSIFVKKKNNNYFMVMSEIFIKTHIPFDPLWQLLNYPITKQEFKQGKSQNSNMKIFFNYIDTLKAYEKQSKIEQQIYSRNRIKKNGINNYFVFIELKNLNFNIDNYYNQKAHELYDSSLITYNNGLFLYNIYIDYQNKQYLPYRSDSVIRQMLSDVEKEFNQSVTYLNKIEVPTSRMNEFIKQLNTILDTAIDELNVQKEKLENYFIIAKKYRVSLFNEQKEKHNN